MAKVLTIAAALLLTATMAHAERISPPWGFEFCEAPVGNSAHIMGLPSEQGDCDQDNGDCTGSSAPYACCTGLDTGTCACLSVEVTGARQDWCQYGAGALDAGHDCATDADCELECWNGSPNNDCYMRLSATNQDSVNWGVETFTAADYTAVHFLFKIVDWRSYASGAWPSIIRFSQDGTGPGTSIQAERSLLPNGFSDKRCKAGTDIGTSCTTDSDCNSGSGECTDTYSLAAYHFYAGNVCSGGNNDGISCTPCTDDSDCGVDDEICENPGPQGACDDVCLADTGGEQWCVSDYIARTPGNLAAGEWVEVLIVEDDTEGTAQQTRVTLTVNGIEMGSGLADTGLCPGNCDGGGHSCNSNSDCVNCSPSENECQDLVNNKQNGISFGAHASGPLPLLGSKMYFDYDDILVDNASDSGMAVVRLVDFAPDGMSAATNADSDFGCTGTCGIGSTLHLTVDEWATATTPDHTDFIVGAAGSVEGEHLELQDLTLTTNDAADLNDNASMHLYSYVKDNSNKGAGSGKNTGICVSNSVAEGDDCTGMRVLLGTDQIDTVNTDATITINETGHGLANGAIVSLQGATAFGGLSASELQVTGAMTIVNADSFTLEADSTATSNASGGGSVAYISSGWFDVSDEADATEILAVDHHVLDYPGTTGWSDSDVDLITLRPATDGACEGSSCNVNFTEMGATIDVEMDPVVLTGAFDDVNGDEVNTLVLFGDSTANQGSFHGLLLSNLAAFNNITLCTRGSTTLGNFETSLTQALDGTIGTDMNCRVRKGSAANADYVWIIGGYNTLAGGNIASSKYCVGGTDHGRCCDDDCTGTSFACAGGGSCQEYPGYCLSEGADNGYPCQLNRTNGGWALGGADLGDTYCFNSNATKDIFLSTTDAATCATCSADADCETVIPCVADADCQTEVAYADATCVGSVCIGECTSGTCAVSISLQAFNRVDAPGAPNGDWLIDGELNTNSCSGLCVGSNPIAEAKRSVDTIRSIAAARTGASAVEIIWGTQPSGDLVYTGKGANAFRAHNQAQRHLQEYILTTAHDNGDHFMSHEDAFQAYVRAGTGPRADLFNDAVHWSQTGYDTVVDQAVACFDNDGVTVHDGVCTANVCSAGIRPRPCTNNLDCATWSCDFTP